MSYFVYIMASQRNGTLSIGVTSNLAKRVLEHKIGPHAGFTKKYLIKNLVYFEEYSDVSLAIEREKKLKRFKRDWKIELIEKGNREWEDLYVSL